jgi:hypothetical protein
VALAAPLHTLLYDLNYNELDFINFASTVLVSMSARKSDASSNSHVLDLQADDLQVRAVIRVCTVGLMYYARKCLPEGISPHYRFTLIFKFEL